MTAPTVERSALANLRHAIALATTELDELMDDADAEAVAWHFVNVQPIRQALNDLARSMEQWLIEVAPWSGDQWQPDDLPVMEVRRGKDRRDWRWDELRTEIRKTLTDPKRNGGEILSTEQHQAVDAALDLMFEVAPLTGSTGPRITAVRKLLGLDPDEYAEVKPGRVSIQIHGDAS